MDHNTVPTKQQEFEELKLRVAQLERELSEAQSEVVWKPTEFYAAYYATTGFLLGGVAALIALLVNMLGAPLAGRHPLELIRVYLTFPLGEKALQLATAGAKNQAVDDNLLLIFGCCLYIGTGMVLGILFQLAIQKFAQPPSLIKRLIVGSVLAIAVWVVAFYGILSWLQPMLFGGNWIVDPSHLPIWVAVGTHLIFGWAMALLAPLGEYTPYRRVGDASNA